MAQKYTYDKYILVIFLIFITKIVVNYVDKYLRYDDVIGHF